MNVVYLFIARERQSVKRKASCRGYMTGSKYAARQSVVYLFITQERQSVKRKASFGGYSEKVTPVPIPNTVVKLLCADNTGRATAWELKSLPELMCKKSFSFLTQNIILYSSVGRACGC